MVYIPFFPWSVPPVLWTKNVVAGHQGRSCYIAGIPMCKIYIVVRVQLSHNEGHPTRKSCSEFGVVSREKAPRRALIALFVLRFDIPTVVPLQVTY